MHYVDVATGQCVSLRQCAMISTSESYSAGQYYNIYSQIQMCGIVGQTSHSMLPNSTVME